MATGRVDVDVLDVGQGQATFVEIYNTDDPAKLINTLLLDLGSENNSESAGKPSADYIVTTLQGMDTPTIDLLVLSHKDADHVNLLHYLLTHFKPSELSITNVVYGGRAEWYPAGLLTTLEKYTPSAGRVRPLLMRASNYVRSTDTFSPYHTIGGVAVYILMANVPESSEITFTDVSSLPTQPQANAANTKSIVCMLEYENEQFIIAGDATYKTLCAINTNFLDKASLFPTVKMLTLPHHGSRKTTFGLSSTNAKISAKKMATIDTFVELIKPESLTVSADRKFMHPSWETITAFWKYTDNEPAWYTDPELDDRHSISIAFDQYFEFPDGSTVGKDEDYGSLQTTLNIYTTLYSLGVDDKAFSFPPAEYIYADDDDPTFPDLPEGVMWYYQITPTTFTLGRYDNRESMDALSFMPKQSLALTAKRTTPKTTKPSPSVTTKRAPPLLDQQTRAATIMRIPIQRPINPGIKGEAHSLSRMKAFR